jgi:hypothetical protein
LLHVEDVITAVECVMHQNGHHPGTRELQSLEAQCIELSTLESIIPGAYLAARTAFEGIRAARIHSDATARKKMRSALKLLRSLPNENWGTCV